MLIISFYFVGEVPKRPELKEESDEDELNSEHNLGEPPPYDLQRRQHQNSLIDTGYKQRFKCHSCEPPDCSNPSVCLDAISCWKSRVRESTGKLFYVDVWVSYARSNFLFCFVG